MIINVLLRWFNNCRVKETNKNVRSIFFVDNAVPCQYQFQLSLPSWPQHFTISIFEQGSNQVFSFAWNIGTLFQVSSFLAPGQLDIILSYPPPNSFFSRGLYLFYNFHLFCVTLRLSYLFRLNPHHISAPEYHHLSIGGLNWKCRAV